jgi:hypothetical protein
MLQNPITEEERQKGQFLHHFLGDFACEQVNFIRSYWKGQPVTVVAISESEHAVEGGPVTPVAVIVTKEIEAQLMPYWELPQDTEPSP